MSDLIWLPSAIVTENMATVIVVVMLKSSPSDGGDALVVLLTRIMPTPPAFWMFTAFALNVQPPRSTTTILPMMVAGSGWQPSFGFGAMPSSPTMRSAVRSNDAGPNTAEPTAGERPDGCITNVRSSLPDHRYTCM